MPIKPFIMDNAVVVGVGNIYASEALFAAGLIRAVQPVAFQSTLCQIDGRNSKRILAVAIEQGGTTLR